MSGKNVWTTYQEQDITALTAMAEGYKAYISEGKTERECAQLTVEMAKEHGYISLEEAGMCKSRKSRGGEKGIRKAGRKDRKRRGTEAGRQSIR